MWKPSNVEHLSQHYYFAWFYVIETETIYFYNDFIIIIMYVVLQIMT